MGMPVQGRLRVGQAGYEVGVFSARPEVAEAGGGGDSEGRLTGCRFKPAPKSRRP